MKYAFIYSLKVWSTALFLSPTLSWLIYKLVNNAIAYVHRNEVLTTGLFYGTDAFKISSIAPILLRLAFYGLPHFIFLFVATGYLNRKAASTRNKKIILTIIALVMTLVFFLIFPIVEVEIVFNELLAWISSFSLFLFAAIWIYKINPIPPKTESFAAQNPIL